MGADLVPRVSGIVDLTDDDPDTEILSIRYRGKVYHLEGYMDSDEEEEEEEEDEGPPTVTERINSGPPVTIPLRMTPINGFRLPGDGSLRRYWGRRVGDVGKPDRGGFAVEEVVEPPPGAAAGGGGRGRGAGSREEVEEFLRTRGTDRSRGRGR